MFVPSRLFQSGLMFAGKAEAYLSGAPFRQSTHRQDPDFNGKHQTRLGRHDKDKRSSRLFQPGLMFAGKAEGYLSGAPFRQSTHRYSPDFNGKH